MIFYTELAYFEVKCNISQTFFFFLKQFQTFLSTFVNNCGCVVITKKCGLEVFFQHIFIAKNVLNWDPAESYVFCNYFTGELKSPLQKALISDKQIHLVGRLLSIRFEVWNSHAILSSCKIHIKCIGMHVTYFCSIWKYRLLSFQGKDTKLEMFLAKNQLYSNEIAKF